MGFWLTARIPGSAWHSSLDPMEASTVDIGVKLINFGRAKNFVSQLTGSFSCSPSPIFRQLWP